MSIQLEPQARVNWLWFGIVVTLLYAGILYAILPPPKTCAAAIGVVRFFDCYELNEAGDFLAGVFAPIAFLWLVVAVLIQSQELSLQRQELAATRAEVTENRRVAQAQADEAKKQAEFIGKQTEILEAERRRAEETEVDRDIAARVAGLVELLRSSLRSGVSLETTDGGTSGYSPPLKVDRGLPVMLIEFAQWFEPLANAIIHLDGAAKFKEVRGLSTGLLQETETRLRLIDRLSAGASAEWRTNLDESHVGKILELIPLVLAAMHKAS
jgi:hypothetical protein